MQFLDPQAKEPQEMASHFLCYLLTRFEFVTSYFNGVPVDVQGGLPVTF
jgi:hypothetical protein